MDAPIHGTRCERGKGLPRDHGPLSAPTQNRTFYAPDREPHRRSVNPPVAYLGPGQLLRSHAPRFITRIRRLRANAVKGSCPSSSYCGSDMRAAYYGGTALTGRWPDGRAAGVLRNDDIADVKTTSRNAKQTNKVPIKGVSTDELL